MNLGLGAWLEIAGGIIAQLGVALWYSGRMDERVRNLRGWTKAMSDQVIDHEKRISRLEGPSGKAH